MVGDSIIMGIEEKLLSCKQNKKVRYFRGTAAASMYDNIKTILKINSEYIMLYIGTSDIINNTPKEILVKM